ncbi:MAG: hypothetical protein ABIP93_08890 [Gemmatimonadaceae bacterium]
MLADRYRIERELGADGMAAVSQRVVPDWVVQMKAAVDAVER